MVFHVKKGMIRSVPLVVYVSFLIVFLMFGSIFPGDVLTAYAAPMTVTTQFQVDEDWGDDEPVAGFKTTPHEDSSTVWGLVWRKETSGWLPTYKLSIESHVGPLHLLDGKVVGKSSEGTSSIDIYQGAPTVGRTYEVTLSYSSNHDVLDLRFKDATDGSILFIGSFSVPSYDEPLYPVAGSVVERYIPVGTAWGLVVEQTSGRLRKSNRFVTRDEATSLWVHAPSHTAMEGEYQVFINDSGKRSLLRTITPNLPEEIYPLPQEAIPVGTFSISMDYVESGEVLWSENETINVGRLDSSFDPLRLSVSSDRVKTILRIQSAEPIEHPVEMDVTVALEQLYWDEEKRDFDYVDYDERIVFQASVDLSSGSVEIPLCFDKPSVGANWKATFSVNSQLPVSIVEKSNERLFSSYSPAKVNEEKPYTIVVFPDTQFMSDSYPWIYTRMTDWVTAHAADLNIAAALHVGDITDRNTSKEWINAHESMSLLHGVVPYALSIGNHDMIYQGQIAERGRSLIDRYFSIDEAKRYSHLVDTMHPSRLENHYYTWSIGNHDYLIISLEFGPPDEAVEWANRIAEQYPDHRMILLTHAYANRRGGHTNDQTVRFGLVHNPDTTVNTGKDMWEKFVSKHGHSFMAVSGHHSTHVSVPYQVRRAQSGQIVYELLVNYQSQPMGGNGWLALMTFHPDDTIHVGLYSPYLDEFANEIDENGYGSQLIIDLSQEKIVPIFKDND